VTNLAGYVERRSPDSPGLWARGQPLVGRLDLELTERCSNDCVHCFINRPEHDRAARTAELPADAVVGILREAASLGCLTVRFTGGEPLLREEFEDLYLAARRLGMRVLLFTNATRMTPRLAGLLRRIPPLEKVEVSIYGMTRDSYEAVSRAPGSFEAAWRGIRLLEENRVPFVVKGALLPPNQGEIDDMEAWAATLPGMDRPMRFSLFFDLRTRRDSGERNRLIRSLRPSPEDAVRFLSRDRERWYRPEREFCTKFMRAPGELLFACGAGLSSGCVDAFGTLQPCLLLRHPEVVYDLRTGTLEEAFRSFFPRMRGRRAASPEHLARCSRCNLKGLCEQCPAKSWSEHGNLDTPVEDLCRVAHARATQLGLLAQGERAWEAEGWQARMRRAFGDLRERG